MTTTVVAGLDVGKDEVHVHANGLGRSYANVPAGFPRLAELAVATGRPACGDGADGGRYHRRVHQSLATAGFEVVVINPLRSRRFGESLFGPAKTDRIDAAMLSRLGAAMPDLKVAKPRDGFEGRA